jgi:hypothetical protein
MRLLRRLAACSAVLVAAAVASPASAQVNVVASAAAVAPNMQTAIAGGPPIAVLTRSDNDLSNFYLQAMQTLCRVAPDNNWCDADLMGVLTDTTNQLGWAQVLNYTSTTTGGAATVCAILPPSPTVSAGTIAGSVSQTGQVFDWRDLTTDQEAQAWLMLRYVGMCEASAGGTQDQKNADAFASLTLTLIEGNPIFVGAQDVSPARKFSFYDGFASTAWATNVGERVLFELWKAQAAAGVSAQSCKAAAVASTNLDTVGVQRDTMLTGGQDCTAQPPVGTVTDSNLWLWTANGGTMTVTWPTVPEPPLAYAPFMSFTSFNAGINYAWQSGLGIASQY